MFGKKSTSGYHETPVGTKVKTLNYGKNMLMVEFIMPKGSIPPAHRHIHEQTGYLVSGSIKMCIGDTEMVCHAGDSWNIASNILHSVEVLEDAVVCEAFTPVREDYVPFLHEEDVVRT